MRALGLALAALLALAAPAAADESIYAGPPSTYFTPDVAIDAGEKVTFTNLDVIGHDVLATSTGPDGKPWFRSEIIGAGGSSDVVGADRLSAGAYGFVCSIHPSMTGTLTVSGMGPPPPPPSSPSSPPADTTAPQVTVAVLDGKVSAVRKRRALRLRLTSDEAATVGITVRSGRTTLASGTQSVAGTKTLTLVLTARGRRIVKKARRLKLTVSVLASDAANNRSGAGASRTLR